MQALMSKYNCVTQLYPYLYTEKFLKAEPSNKQLINCKKWILRKTCLINMCPTNKHYLCEFFEM